MSTVGKSQIEFRQIRALYDDETITVYQAYSASIATAAVREQKLSASPDFSYSRMTWIKPSWTWMMYRSGYGTKDARQARILAIRMKHSNFKHLLSLASVTHGDALTAEDRKKPVRVQWDPERSVRIGMLPYRSIQIGISREVSQKWVEEWIDSITDVTAAATGLMEAITGDNQVSVEELVERGFVPAERIYEVDDDLRRVLKMDG